MEFTKNILFDKIIFYVDLDNKKITRNYYHNSLVKLYNYFKNQKDIYFYKRDGIFNLNINYEPKINPLIQKFILYDLNNMKIDSDKILNDYINNIPFWLICKNENINVSKIQIIYFDNSIKELTEDFIYKSLYQILKK